MIRTTGVRIIVRIFRTYVNICVLTKTGQIVLSTLQFVTLLLLYSSIHFFKPLKRFVSQCDHSESGTTVSHIYRYRLKHIHSL